MSTNDNHSLAPTAPSLPDPHGQAALLLVESLIHGLVARSVISVEASLEIMETAIDVQIDVAKAADGAGAPMWQAHSLLTAMSESMKLDLVDPWE